MTHPPSARSDTTRERILSAAEQLFRSRGVGSTSLRSITAAAGVNVAAVHYHFGGRDRLAREVFARSVAPVNEERLRRLAGVEACGGRPDLEALVRALLEPVFRAADPGLREIGALLLAEPRESGRELLEELFGEVMERFHLALCRALPEQAPEELRDRLRFGVGAFVHVLVGPTGEARGGRGARPGEDGCAGSDRATLERLVRFLVAGFAAPPCRPPLESS